MNKHAETASMERISIPPDDTHNRTLISNVHPPDWANPAPQGRYNLVVLGAGTGGLVTAIGSAGLGAKVALVERHLMGGDCLNVGCIPSKALISAAKVYAQVRDAADYGVSVPEGVRVDFPKVMERMRRLRAQISPNDSAQRYRERGVDLFLGEGRFTGPDTLEVGGKTLRFSKAVIATGARASAPPIAGLKDVEYLTNENLFNLTELPRRLAIIGAGPIGVEMAQAFARFGSEVYLLEGAKQVLIREDRDAAQRVEAALLKDGVKLIMGCKITGVQARGSEKIVEMEGCPEVVADQILIAVGRAPNVEGIGLEQAGVEFDPRLGVKVDDTLQTSNPRIYAVGDVASKYKFTHMADALARIAIQNALFPGFKKKASDLIVPWCTYTDPEIAHVGMYDKDAQAQGMEIDTFIQEFKEVDRAILDGEEKGFVKVHVRKGTDKILGATIVARHAGDMIGELSLAMRGGLGLGILASTIHPYPTQAEGMKRVGDAYNRTRLKPGVKSMFAKWFAWTR